MGPIKVSNSLIHTLGQLLLAHPPYTDRLQVRDVRRPFVCCLIRELALELHLVQLLGFGSGSRYVYGWGGYGIPSCKMGLGRGVGVGSFRRDRMRGGKVRVGRPLLHVCLLLLLAV